ncbi:MAG: aromatic ring-hydroxylating dioxygenase subunit alpha [Candidatus Eremiobacteraeota bacterium]|nr:aromatic ring-hydroxylating dioxygenase subunit alpha [Candidatus Eremiobacteraeota bacterium]
MSTFLKPNVAPGARTLESRWYVSPELFALERERIFSRQWICVGRLESIENPGDYFVANVGDESLIVTRDRDRRPRAYYNVCRHRGTRICESTAGHFSGSIQCPYHAWTYGLDGTLKTARNMAGVPGFASSDFPLHEASLATWEGFVFATIADEPVAFERAFEAVQTRFSRWNISELRTAKTIRYDLPVNWKLIFQNYSECYHCPLVHPQLDKLSPSDSGRNDLLEGAFLGGFSELRHERGSLTTTGSTTREPVGHVSGDDLSRIYYYTLFPSMLLSLHPDYVMVHYVRALAIDRTEVVCAWLFDAKAMARPDFDAADAVDFWDLTNRQDWRVSELTQAGVRSKAYVPGPYANAEGLLAAFDRHYLAVMGAEKR